MDGGLFMFKVYLHTVLHTCMCEQLVFHRIGVFPYNTEITVLCHILASQATCSRDVNSPSADEWEKCPEGTAWGTCSRAPRYHWLQNTRDHYVSVISLTPLRYWELASLERLTGILKGLIYLIDSDVKFHASYLRHAEHYSFSYL